MATTGYTLDEMFKFGFFTLTLIATRPATAEETEHGCDYYEECPCCTCGEDVVSVETYAGVRWSKSAKRMVETIRIQWSCAEHKA